MSEVRHATDPVSGETVTINNSLVNRLRGKYAVGPTLPNGEPEFGWRQMGPAILIQDEAAAEIERLRLRLAAILTWTENWNCPWEGEDEWREDLRLAKNAVAGKPD